MFIVGIDIAKRSHEAIIIAEDGQVVRKAFSFRNNCTGYNLLLEQVRRLTLVKSQIVFAMESTAHYWLALYARLLKDGYTVLVLNPIQSHSLRELYIRKTKTDARDSLIIADLVRFGRCKASNVPQDKILALRGSRRRPLPSRPFRSAPTHSKANHDTGAAPRIPPCWGYRDKRNRLLRRLHRRRAQWLRCRRTEFDPMRLPPFCEVLLRNSYKLILCKDLKIVKHDNIITILDLLIA